MQKIVIVDDHSVVREGLKLMLGARYGEQNITLLENGKDLLTLLQEQVFDLIILDVQLPDIFAFSLIPLILEIKKRQKILILSMYDEIIMGQAFLERNAMGYVNKAAPRAELLLAIEMVLDGKQYVSTLLQEHLSNPNRKKVRETNPFLTLSNREKEVMLLMLRGLGILEISNFLDLKNTTVATYRKRIFDKMQVENVIELYKKSVLFGLT